MAAIPPVPPDQSLTNLIGIRNTLNQIADSWHDIARTNKTIGKELGNAFGEAQKLNRILSANEDIEARIGTELVSRKKANKLLVELAAQEKAINEKSLALSKEERKVRDDTQKSLAKDEKKRDKLEKQLSSRTSKKLSDDEKRAIGTEIEVLEAGIRKLKSNKDFIKVNFIEELLAQAKAATKNAEGLMGRVKEGNSKAITEFNRQKFGKKIAQHFGVQEHYQNFQDFGAMGALKLGGVGIALTVAKALVDQMFKANQQITDIQRGFNMSGKEASKLRDYFKSASNIASEVDSTQQDIIDAQVAIRDATGLTVIYSKDNLNTLAGIQNTINLSADAVKGLTQYANLSGKSFENIRDRVLGTTTLLQLGNKVTLDNKKILEKVLTASGEIRANFRGNVEELTKAVTKSQQYGTSLEEIEKTSSSLLDFESSISNQLEAELLTNKHINLEKARAAALTGDTNALMDEVVKQAGTFDEFNKMNVIAQTSLAKVFGFSRGELSDMLIKQKEIAALSKIGRYDTTQTIEENYESLKRLGATSEQITAALGKQVAANLEQQSASERFQKVLTRLQEIIANLFEGEKLENAVSWVAAKVKAIADNPILGAFKDVSEEQAKIKASLNPSSNGVDMPKRATSMNSLETAPFSMMTSGQADKLISVMEENTRWAKTNAEKSSKIVMDTTDVTSAMYKAHSGVGS